LKDLKLSASDFISFHSGRFLDFYTIEKILGEGRTLSKKCVIGAFGQVYRCVHRQTKTLRAVKTILKQGFYNEEEKQRFLTEITILKQMDHPNILKLFEVFQDESRYYQIGTQSSYIGTT
jgi:calcium-dependent protein kinase